MRFSRLVLGTKEAKSVVEKKICNTKVGVKCAQEKFQVIKCTIRDSSRAPIHFPSTKEALQWRFSTPRDQGSKIKEKFCTDKISYCTDKISYIFTPEKLESCFWRTRCRLLGLEGPRRSSVLLGYGIPPIGSLNVTVYRRRVMDWRRSSKLSAWYWDGHQIYISVPQSNCDLSSGGWVKTSRAILHRILKIGGLYSASSGPETHVVI